MSTQINVPDQCSPSVGEIQYWKAFVHVGVAFLVTVVLFGMFFVIASPRYETNDDVAMMRIVSGTMTGEASEYLVFTNVLIGRFLKQLYQAAEDVNWYSFYICATHFAATLAVLFAFLRRSSDRLGLSLVLLVVVVFEFRLLLLTQFTSTAAVAAIGGILLLLSDSQRTASAIALFLAGAFLLAFSAMIRFQSFGFVLVLLVPLIVNQFRLERSYWLPSRIAVAILLALMVRQYDNSVYSQHEGWRQFREYNALRGPLHARPLPVYDSQTRGFYDSVGWSENDVALWGRWFFSDSVTYSNEKLAKVKAEFGKRVTTQLMTEFFKGLK